jgi:hypothetical protein
MALRTPTRTELLGATAVGLTVSVIALELRAIRRRAPDPEHPLETTREVAAAGYRAAPSRENALLNLLLSYAITAGVVRLSTHQIRVRGSFGPFRNASLGGRHIHHFIPGIAMAFLSGGASILARNEKLDPFFAVPFGIGAALTLDEAALLVELEDVYWSEEGILSVQATLGTLALLGGAALTVRTLKRGEAEVLDEPG